MIGRPRSGARAQARGPPAPLRSQIREKLEHGKPLQEQLPLNQIKTEPPDYESKPAASAPSGGVFSGGAAPLQGTLRAVVLPAGGPVAPISINLADLQNALQVAVDGNVLRQLTSGQQLISAISLPLVGRGGTAKIIINYSLAPSLKTEPPSTDSFKSQRLPEDLTLRAARPPREEEPTKTCLLCDERPAGLQALHGKDPEGGLGDRNLLALLKAYCALKAGPPQDELHRVSDSLPVIVVKSWFHKMQEGHISLGAPTPPSEEEGASGVGAPAPGKDPTAASPSEASPAAPSPGPAPPSTEGPLDLSLPRLAREEAERAAAGVSPSLSSGSTDEPLNLTCTKKEASPLWAGGPVAPHARRPGALDIVATMRCLLTPRLQDALHLNGLKVGLAAHVG